jgi:DNA polymerase-3 subunit epsilon
MDAKYVVIDTETSGLFDFTKPADAEGQPRMASLALIYLDADLNTIAESMHWVKPDGWVMPAEATKVNGITMEFLEENGEPVMVALAEYIEAVDKGMIVVAHNAQYDLKILRGELRRAEIDDRFSNTKNICTMRALTPIVKAPKKKGYGFKFPRLDESCAFFGIKQEAAHTALEDAKMAAEMLRRLVEMGSCPEPDVYFAKEVR